MIKKIEKSLYDSKTLQAYNSAIAFLPDDIDNNVKARLYIYSGAMLKRLNRLKESESNIELGLKYATNPYEINDGLYNLACIMAMQNKKAKFNEVSMKLKNNDPNKYDHLILKLKTYAPEFKWIP